MSIFLLWLAMQQPLKPNKTTPSNSCYIDCVDGRLRSTCPYFGNEGEACGESLRIDAPAVRCEDVCWVRGNAVTCPCMGGWTCADQSRILLTAEDGKRWCHKVQP